MPSPKIVTGDAHRVPLSPAKHATFVRAGRKGLSVYVDTGRDTVVYFDERELHNLVATVGRIERGEDAEAA